MAGSTENEETPNSLIEIGLDPVRAGYVINYRVGMEGKSRDGHFLSFIWPALTGLTSRGFGNILSTRWLGASVFLYAQAAI